jgi:hypothetical protein
VAIAIGQTVVEPEAQAFARRQSADITVSLLLTRLSQRVNAMSKKCT